LFGRHWRLALTAVLSLSVAIAATVMGFSAYNALLLRPPGVGDPRSLRLIHIRTLQDPFGEASFPDYAFYRNQTRAFSGIAAYPYSISTAKFNDGDRNERVVVTYVSNNFFQVLDIRASLGALVFRSSPSNDVHDIVLSRGLWKKLGADPHIVGRTVKLNDVPLTIVGVAPATFGGMTWGFNPDVWMALRTSEPVFGNAPAQMTDRNLRWLPLMFSFSPPPSRRNTLKRRRADRPCSRPSA